MKKHFITGVLLLAVTAGGFSTFTSCKDTDEDLYNQVNSEQVSLKAALEALKTKCENCSTNCATKISELEALIGNLPDGTDKTNIVDWVKELLATKADQETVNNILETLNGKDGAPGLIARIEALEQKKEKEDQFKPNEVNDIMDLIALKSKLQEFFKEGTGTLDGINSDINGINTDIDKLEEALNGKDGNPGLIQQVGDLSKWFEGCGWKDADEFQNLVNQGQFIIDNNAALQYLLKFTEENEYKLNQDAIKALNGVYEDLAGIKTMYEKIFKTAQLPEGATDWWNYGEVMQNIMDNSAAIADLQDDVNKLLNRLNDMVTSLVLQASHNSVFGGFNTPFGINSMVLMTCYGERATQVNSFPASGRGAECYSTANDDIDWSTITSESYSVPELIVSRNADGKATLGNFWFTVNPGTVNTLDLDGFALVNSRDDEPVVELTNIEKDDETVLKFGVGTRAAGNGNGLYQAQAVVPVEDLSKIKVNIEPGLAQAIKDAVQNRTASDMATMLKKVYAQLQDICEANALRYTYEAATAKDANNNWIMTPQKVYSNYGIAATAFKPLSFATLKGTSIRHIPTFGSIEISKDMVDLDLGKFEIGEVSLNIDIKIASIKLDKVNETIIKVKVPKKFDVDEENKTADLPADWESRPEYYDEIEVNITKDLQAVVDKLAKNIDTWINGDKDNPGLNDQINSAVKEAVDKAFNGPDGFIAKIENQVNDMMGGIQDKLNNLVDQINNDYLGKVNTLIDKYNAVAERVNKVLDDPNHYLQSVLLYKKAGKLAWNGGSPEVELPFGVLSTDPELPTIFKGSGEAISLWATTYSFETVAPAFKKIVGVVKVTDRNGNEKPELKQQANATLAKILSHNQYRVALNVKGAADGDRYEVAYQALDYTGHTSTVKCYIMIAR